MPLRSLLAALCGVWALWPALALAQSGLIADRLRAAGHPCELVEVRTPGGERSYEVLKISYS